MTVVSRVIAGAVVAAIVAVAGYRARALTASGAIAAGVMGTVAVAAGWDWAAVLIAYFGVSSLLSRIGAQRKATRLSGMVDKTGPRDATQVMANGGPFFFCALMSFVAPYNGLNIWQTSGAASLAASAADTWATEIGTLVGQPPRSILTLRRMPVGESGGVTLAGWIAAFVGASFVGAVAIALMPIDGQVGFWLIVLGGMSGALMDSVVGASIQRRAWCDVCGQPTEMSIHTCGTATRHVGGLAWLENDGVNLIATVTGALVAGIVVLLAMRSVSGSAS